MVCREVTAAGELMVEVWDLGGTRGAKQMKKLADNPSQVIRNSRFLGQAEIPLVDTLTDTQRGDQFNQILVKLLLLLLASNMHSRSRCRISKGKLGLTRICCSTMHDKVVFCFCGQLECQYLQRAGTD